MANSRKYNVGLVQMRMGPDPESNLEAALEHVRQAARLGANIVCLPELFQTQYFCQREDIRLFDLAEPIPGPTTARLAEAARRERVAIVASLFERRTAGLYHNTAVTLNADGAIVSIYRKMHIPDDPLYYEKFYFTPGDLGFQAVDTAYGRIGTLVCWDQWYPEGARLTALQGSSSIPPPSAGTRPRRMSSELRNTTPGRPSSAPTRSPTVSMWPVSIASAWSTAISAATAPRALASSSGAAAF